MSKYQIFLSEKTLFKIKKRWVSYPSKGVDMKPKKDLWMIVLWVAVTTIAIGALVGVSFKVYDLFKWLVNNQNSELLLVGFLGVLTYFLTFFFAHWFELISLILLVFIYVEVRSIALQMTAISLLLGEIRKHTLEGFGATVGNLELIRESKERQHKLLKI